MGAVPQNWVDPTKNFIKNKVVEFQKVKIIMCLWSVALKARKAAKWPRTFYMVWTVVRTYSGCTTTYYASSFFFKSLF